MPWASPEAAAGAPKTLGLARPATPSAPLPGLPVVARVHVEVAPTHALVVHDVALPPGEDPGPLRLFVAFGAPGAPRAFDAQLMPWPAPSPAAAWPLAVERAARRPAWAQPLFGALQKGGAVVHVPPRLLRSLAAATGEAMLRLRALHAPPAEDGEGRRSLLVRLGVPGGHPLTVERVEVVAAAGAPPVLAASAHLCGPDADGRPLRVETATPSLGAAADATTILPGAAVRHDTDDLCVVYRQADYSSEASGARPPSERPPS